MKVSLNEQVSAVEFPYSMTVRCQERLDVRLGAAAAHVDGLVLPVGIVLGLLKTVSELKVERWAQMQRDK